MDKVVHFGIPYDELERVKKFYIEAFGWKINTIVRTTEVDGGMYKRDDASSKTPVLVINVTNIDESLKKTQKLGAKIFRKKWKLEIWGFMHRKIQKEILLVFGRIWGIINLAR